jgi:hypothetical protein
VGLNPLQNVAPDERRRVTADIVSALTRPNSINWLIAFDRDGNS